MQDMNETLQDLVFRRNGIDIDLKRFIAEPGLESSFMGNDMDLPIKPTVTVIQPGNVKDMDVRRWGTHTRKGLSYLSLSSSHKKKKSVEPSEALTALARPHADSLRPTACRRPKVCALGGHWPSFSADSSCTHCRAFRIVFRKY